MKKSFLGLYIIGSAIIWAFVIILASIGLVNFVYNTSILIIFGLGALLHILLVWGLLSIKVKKELSEE